MFVYFKKRNNNVLYVSPYPLGNSEDQLYLPEGGIPIFRSEYDVVELDVEIPYNFEQNKYKLEDNIIVYTDISLEIQDKWTKIRQKRNVLLKESDVESGIIWLDFWNLKDEATREAWLTYRQALRDIPQGDNPDNVVWPQKPGSIV